MRSTQRALRFCLIALAGALAATVAHVVIDVAGDYVLARDAYDGVAHHSRVLLLAVIGLAVLLAAARAICDMLDRRCGSTKSTLAAVRDALGNPAAFALSSACVAVITLIGMESFDSSLTGRLDDIGDLFGGSVALGAGTALIAGAVVGWLTHRFVRILAAYEAPIAAFIVAVLNFSSRGTGIRPIRHNLCVSPAVAYALILSRQGSKRGPPRPVFG